MKKITLKYIIVGDTGVGKSSLLNLFANDYYDFSHKPTIGIAMKTYNYECENKQINIQFWDTAGQERYDSLSRMYYRNSICTLFIFDITNIESFLSLDKWIKKVKKEVYNEHHIVIIGNKYDLENNRKVTFEEATIFAKNNNCKYYETSCNNKEQIKKIIFDTFETSYNLHKDYFELLNPRRVKIEDYSNNNYYSKYCNC
jgi:small GTP-binding protein